MVQGGGCVGVVSRACIQRPQGACMMSVSVSVSVVPPWLVLLVQVVCLAKEKGA